MGGHQVARAGLPRVGEPVADAQLVGDQPVGRARTRRCRSWRGSARCSAARTRPPRPRTTCPRRSSARRFGPRVRPLIEHDAAGAVPHAPRPRRFGRSASGTSASVSGAPSGASNGKSSSSPWVGAMSASVTSRSTSPRAGMCPGPYSSSGTWPRSPRARSGAGRRADEVGLLGQQLEVAERSARCPRHVRTRSWVGAEHAASARCRSQRLCLRTPGVARGGPDERRRPRGRSEREATHRPFPSPAARTHRSPRHRTSSRPVRCAWPPAAATAPR